MCKIMNINNYVNAPAEMKIVLLWKNYDEERTHWHNPKKSDYRVRANGQSFLDVFAKINRVILMFFSPHYS